MPTDMLQSMLSEIKHYANQKKNTITEGIMYKIIILLYILILIFALTALSIIAIFYLLFTLAYVLEPYIGGLIYSYALITGIIILFGGILYKLRRRFILRPLTQFITNLFQDDKDDSNNSFHSGITMVLGIMNGIKIIKQIMRVFR